MPSTVRLHRVLQAKPDHVYRAFLDPDAKAKWLPLYSDGTSRSVFSHSWWSRRFRIREAAVS